MYIISRCISSKLYRKLTQIGSSLILCLSSCLSFCVSRLRKISLTHPRVQGPPPWGLTGASHMYGWGLTSLDCIAYICMQRHCQSCFLSATLSQRRSQSSLLQCYSESTPNILEVERTPPLRSRDRGGARQGARPGVGS